MGTSDTLAEGDPAATVDLPVVDPSCYELAEELARGGFGRLIRARDRRLDREVAIKQLRATNAQLEARFRLEARITARLSHPAIVPVHEVGRWPSGEPFYAMKLVTGRSLRAVLDATPALADRLGLVAAVAQIADALGYAHREGIIHRDVKPGNLMLDGEGHAYVVDWGLAKDQRSPDRESGPASLDAPTALELTQAGSILGTPPYLAPEQARGEPVDARADVYAIGALLYELLACAPPYVGDDVASMLAKIATTAPPRLLGRQPSAPRELVAIVERAMAREAAARYPSATELAADLLRFGRGELVSAYRYSRGERIWRYVQRHRGIALTGLAITASITAAALFVARHTAPRAWYPSVRELEAFDENSNGAVFSPDGKQIVFDSDRAGDGVMSPWVGPIDGKARLLRVPTGAGKRVRFTRDGEAILYRSTGGVFRMPLDGHAPELVVPGGASTDDCGRAIVAARPIDPGCPSCAQEIVARERDGQLRQIVRLDPNDEITWVRCDRSGRRIVYHAIGRVGGNAPAGRIVVADLATGTSRVIVDRDVDYPAGPTFHPDGRSIVYSSSRGGLDNLWEIALDGGEPQQLTFGGGPDLSPDISPDGAQLVFDVDVSFEPLLAMSCGRAERRLTTALEFTTWIDLSADEQHIVSERESVRGRSQIVVVAIADRREHVLGPGKTPRFANDSDHVFWADGERLVEARLDGSDRRTVATLPGPIGALAMAPDDTVHVRVVVGRDVQAWRVAADGTVARDNEHGTLVWPAPRGGWTAVLEFDHQGVELVPPGGVSGDPHNEIWRNEFLSWDRDGSSFLYRNGTVLRRHDLVGQRDEQLCEVPGSLEGLAPASDRNLFYVSHMIGRVRRQLITNYGERPRP